jgi:hypothetical protein
VRGQHSSDDELEMTGSQIFITIQPGIKPRHVYVDEMHTDPLSGALQMLRFQPQTSRS